MLAGLVTGCRRGDAAGWDKEKGTMTSALARTRRGGEGVLTGQATGRARRSKTQGTGWSVPPRRGLG